MQTNGVKSRDPVVVRSAGSVVAVRPGGDDLATTDLMRSNSRASGSAPGLVTRTPRNPPSKVVFLWTLPVDADEGDIVPLCAPFGGVCKVLILRSKLQALVEMESLPVAEALVQYFVSNPCVVRGVTVFVDFSTHSHVELKPASEVTEHHDVPSPVLHVRVAQVAYPVSIDTLHAAFKPYGSVLRIIIFTKADMYMALIELDSIASATAAKSALDGQFLFSGCNRLFVTYSRLNRICVKYNNDKSRDFTDDTLPTVPPEAMGYVGKPAPVVAHKPLPAPEGVLGNPGGVGSPAVAAVGPYFPHYATRVPGYPVTPMFPTVPSTPVLIVSGYDAERVTPYHLFVLFGLYGDVMKVKKFYKRPDEALVQFRSPEQAVIGKTHLNGAVLFGRAIRVNFSKTFEVNLHTDASGESSGLGQDFTGSPLHRYASGRHMKHVSPPTTTVHVANIPAATPVEDVRAVFEAQGSIVGLKLLPLPIDGAYTKMALVTYSSVEEATTALINVHNHLLGDKHLRVSFSRTSVSDAAAARPAAG